MTAILDNRRCLLAAAIISAEALLLVLAYRLGFGVSIALSPSQGICEFVGGGASLCAAMPSLLAIYAIIFVVPVISFLATGRIDPAPAIAAIQNAKRPDYFLVLNFAGLAALSAPWLLVLWGFPDTAMSKGGLLWTLGTLFAVGGFALWLSEPRNLLAFFTPVRSLVLIIPILIAIASVGAGGYFWAIDWVKTLTFRSTDAFLRMIGESTDLHAADIMIIGVGDFRAKLLEGCSGFSGMAMVSLVVFLYGLASRQRLKLGRVLVLIPLAILLSWIVNILRISSIMLIGAYVSPDLAINAFHSYAGWISFTVLSAILIILSESVPWFRRAGNPANRPATRFFSDRTAAEILPFALFLATGLIVSALFPVPAAGYPIIAIVAGLSIAAFFPIYSGVLQSICPLSVASGLFVGILWLFAQGGGDPVPIADILGAAAPAMAGIWVLMRLIGTILFIPLIEEMFFRSYLLRRLDFGGGWGPTVALILTSVAFASLHGEWVLALIAGLIFGGLVLRSGKVGDAVVAHVVANATIALWAISIDDWSVI
jgi:exosortase E/protease (VPEID-CTERM system)